MIAENFQQSRIITQLFIETYKTIELSQLQSTTHRFIDQRVWLNRNGISHSNAFCNYGSHQFKDDVDFIITSKAIIFCIHSNIDDFVNNQEAIFTACIAYLHL